jgi:N-acetyl-beta-hexosaminidase
MIDVAGDFIEEEVIKIMDVIAVNKVHKLHLHLTGDQGWRL